MILSKDNNKAGNNKRLASIANINVIDTKIPRATVPPKSEKTKIKKPKNNTIEV